jgi:hypothetical protein
MRGAGDGVFTRRSFSKGDIVSISPLVNIPKHIMNKIENETVLGNYCFSTPESDDLFLPIGTAAMINHGGCESDKNSLVNLRVEWYQWDSNHIVGAVREEDKNGISGISDINDGKQTSETSKKDGEDGKSTSPYGLYDFAYIATRDIGSGEELFISYGRDWDDAWKRYRDDRSDARWQGNSDSNDEGWGDHSDSDSSGSSEENNVFRHFISL